MTVRTEIDCSFCRAPNLRTDDYHIFDVVWTDYTSYGDREKMDRTVHLCRLCYDHMKRAFDECVGCRHPGAR